VGTLTTGLVLFAGTLIDRRRVHANLVAVWTELREVDRESLLWETPGTSQPKIEARIKIEDWSDLSGPYSFGLRIKNSGRQPIYGCDLHVRLDQDPLPSGAYPVLYNELQLDLGILGPDTEAPPVSLLVGAPHSGGNFAETLAKAMSFEMSFTDTTGRTWTRDERGRLGRGRRKIPAEHGS
jgi:hypothetical protein